MIRCVITMHLSLMAEHLIALETVFRASTESHSSKEKVRLLIKLCGGKTKSMFRGDEPRGVDIIRLHREVWEYAIYVGMIGTRLAFVPTTTKGGHYIA